MLLAKKILENYFGIKLFTLKTIGATIPKLFVWFQYSSDAIVVRQIAVVGGWKGQIKCISHFWLVGTSVDTTRTVHTLSLKVLKELTKSWILYSHQLLLLTRELLK